MIDFEKIIAEAISNVTNIEEEKLITFIEIPKDTTNGDYAFPCFKLAKELKKAPQMIAEEIKSKIELDNNLIREIVVIGGYLNFYINTQVLATEVLQEISASDEYGKSKYGNGKNVVIDYSAPNIAKPFHIGHLRSTVIGGALYNIYKYLGYNVTGINHLGDYGTQFGKLIEGYKLWGNEYDIESNPIDELTKIYVRINQACKEDENILNKTGKLVESQGAKVVNLEYKGINTPCIIEKSNGSTTYATRDLAAILYRARTYDFDKALYVTSYEQVLHFKQIFEVAKLLGLDEKYTNGLEHIPFGMVLLPTGKMSTREGTSVKLLDLLNEAIERASKIIEQKNPDLANKEDVAKKVGVGAVIFNDLSNSRIKDEIFDWDTILNFQGETGPYIQYTYVRTKSVIEKAGGVPDANDIDVSLLLDEYSIKILKLIYNFENILIQVTDKNEPSILSRYLIDLAKAYSNFYNENKIIVDDKNLQNARAFLTYSVGNVLKIGANLLGIEMPDKM